MKKIILVAATLMVFASCYNDKYGNLYPLPATTVTTTCDTDTTISYATNIQPIIAANCYSPGNGCHDAVGSSLSGYDYQTSITALQANAANGLLLGDINWESGHNDMPKNAAQLSACDINMITRWVNEGAPNN